MVRSVADAEFSLVAADSPAAAVLLVAWISFVRVVLFLLDEDGIVADAAVADVTTNTENNSAASSLSTIAASVHRHFQQHHSHDDPHFYRKSASFADHNGHHCLRRRERECHLLECRRKIQYCFSSVCSFSALPPMLMLMMK